MTIDERLDRLTERHEALTQTVELIAHMQRENEEAQKKNLKIGCGLMCRHSSARQALIDQIRDGKMGEIRKAGKVSGTDRIAVMAALNIAHEFLSTKLDGGFDIGRAKRRISSIEARLDEALAQQDKLF